MVPLWFADDRSVRRKGEVANRGGVPVIAARQSGGIIHALLHDRPIALAAENESMQVKLKAVSDSVVVDARGETAGAHQRVAVETKLVGERA